MKKEIRSPPLTAKARKAGMNRRNIYSPRNILNVFQNIEKMTLPTTSGKKMGETAGETPEATEKGKQEKYSKMGKSYAIEDWIHRAPKREAETAQEVDKSLKKIAEYEEILKRRDLEGWRARGWEEMGEWAR